MKPKKQSKPHRPFIKCAECGKELGKGVKKYKNLGDKEFRCEICYFNE